MSPVFYTAAPKMCLHQTPGRRPPPITGRFVNNVTRGWVGAPNERTPFRFHGAVLCFVERCLSRTRNLTASSQLLAEFFSRRSSPKIGPGIIFFGVFDRFELVLTASGTEIFWRVFLKFYLFMETSRFHCNRCKGLKKNSPAAAKNNHFFSSFGERDPKNTRRKVRRRKTVVWQAAPRSSRRRALREV